MSTPSLWRDSETVLFIDSWNDYESLDRHHTSLMMERIAKPREKDDFHMRVERFLSDEETEIVMPVCSD